MKIKTIISDLVKIIFTPRRSIQRIAEEGRVSVAIGLLVIIGVIDAIQDPLLWPVSDEVLFSRKLDMLAEVCLSLFGGVVFCGILHLSALLFKGKGRYKTLFVVITYIDTAIFTLGSILSLLLDKVQNFLNLLLGLIMIFWCLSLWFLAVRYVHRLSMGRSIGSISLMIAILLLILIVLRQFLTPPLHGMFH